MRKKGYSMELIDFYKNLENPLSNTEQFLKIIEAYSKSIDGGFYKQLVYFTPKDSSPRYFLADENELTSHLFNTWKNRITSMELSTFHRLRDEGKVANDFAYMRSYLKKVPDVSTSFDARKILFLNEDEAMTETIDRYRWNRMDDPTWIHVSSLYVNSYQEENFDVEHRLYLNMELIDTYKIVNLFLKGCEERNLPYYFKFDRTGSRDDSLVIYSDTLNLANYISILEDIKNKHKDLSEKIKRPPILTGMVNEFIGYGSEPLDKKSSYTMKRSSIIEKAIKAETLDWLSKNKNKKIRYNGKYIDFYDYLSKKSTITFFEQLKFNLSKSSNLGYSLSDLNDTTYENVYQIIKNRINTSYDDICNNDRFDNISFEVRNGKSIIFSKEMLDTTIKELTIQIANHDNNYLEGIKKKIESDSEPYGINKDNFAFDTLNRNLIESRITQEKGLDDRFESDNHSVQIKSNIHK